ncbi:hypothetical protein [Accumulibacter sp.]|uniref:hypothetical protein n=1 Tax=Accumulibacter sp. TaxID=2053492 RepID=UPI0026204712|nr:hypothetical protein [Accumulibacter sp.]
MNRLFLTRAASALLLCAGGAQAEALAPIERLKITDNDLSCQQLYDERGEMEKIAADAHTTQFSGQAAATAGQAAGVAAAELATRVGLFGPIGGLAGTILAGITSRTTAKLAEQQLQLSAAEAAEREKQALGRKEHLTELFLSKGCSAGDPSAPARPPAAGLSTGTAAAASGVASVKTAPSVNKTLSTVASTTSPARSSAIKVEVVSPEDLRDSGKTLVVPTAFVSLLAAGQSTASGAPPGALRHGQRNGQMRVDYRVGGIDKDYAQSLAKAAYEDFIGQLRQAGYTVLTYADVRERDYVRNAQREAADSMPSRSEFDGTHVTAAPSDQQHFKSGLSFGVLAEFQSGGRSRFPDATLVIPSYVFSSPQVWARGSQAERPDSVSGVLTPGMNLIFASAYWLGQSTTRTTPGFPGAVTREAMLDVSEKAGELTRTADATPLATDFSGSPNGAGKGPQRSAAFLFTIDREAYAQGVMTAVRQFNAEVARLAAAAAR